MKYGSGGCCAAMLMVASTCTNCCINMRRSAPLCVRKIVGWRGTRGKNGYTNLSGSAARLPITFSLYALPINNILYMTPVLDGRHRRVFIFSIIWVALLILIKPICCFIFFSVRKLDTFSTKLFKELFLVSRNASTCCHLHTRFSCIFNYYCLKMYEIFLLFYIYGK